MTGREFLNAPGMKIVLPIFALAVAVAGWAAIDARNMTVDTASSSTAPLAAAGLSAPLPTPDVDVGEVVQSDPFSQMRKAPKKRYLLPGEADPEAPKVVATPTVREPPKPVVLGIVIGSDSTKSFCSCQMGAAQPKLIKVGMKIGEYTLVSIGKKSVVFANAAGQQYEVWQSR
jgi:hypothetical protein